MYLYTLLKDRASINILKILYDNETADKKYTMLYPDMKSRLHASESTSTLPNLVQAGLISTEKTEKGSIVLSITKKGKQFVEHFDRLVEVMSGKKEEQKAYQVQYGLTPMEQRILVLCMKMKSESGGAVPLKMLTQEAYPYKEPASKTGAVSRYAKRLEELNLLTKFKKNNRTFLDITESGERVIKEQFMNIATPNT
ncbi:MAG: hypothetical protein KKD17_03790 [Nanoarchaeota archaeon]|nr:hypothetical protein [Nanoarchaeota archaeon]